MARRKERVKDLKKQRWAGIVAAILALGMIGSLVIGYIGQAIGGGSGAPAPQEQVEPQPEDYLAHYKGEVDRLEAYIAEHQATEAVLLELAENYRYLVFIQQLFFEDPDALAEYQDSLTAVYPSLMTLDPTNSEYRLELINLYMEQQASDELISEEIASLTDMLRDNPDPLVHLSLVGLLSASDKDELFDEEAQWLFSYLNQKVTEETAGKEEKYYFAVLLGQYLDDSDQAELILLNLTEQIDESSPLHQEVENYYNYLVTESESEDILP